MLQSKQGTTYLTNQGCGVTVDVVVGVAEPKLDDMAGTVAAPDASPPAAVLLVVAVATVWLLLPRVEDACWVAGDALLEGQQGVPLTWYAGRATVVSSGVDGRLLCMGRRHEEEAAGGGGGEEQHQLGS
jgi:hypothetical protein